MITLFPQFVLACIYADALDLNSLALWVISLLKSAMKSCAGSAGALSSGRYGGEPLPKNCWMLATKMNVCLFCVSFGLFDFRLHPLTAAKEAKIRPEDALWGMKQTKKYVTSHAFSSCWRIRQRAYGPRRRSVRLAFSTVKCRSDH